jgi:hypothetical protein
VLAIYFPAAHGVQLPAAAAAEVPTAHIVQLVSPDAAKVPATQPRHAAEFVAPVIVVVAPAAQLVQLVVPEVEV